MSSSGFRPLAGNRDCEDCLALQRIACRNGDVLTFVREPSDLFPLAVRVYVHPDCVDLASFSETDRADFRGPWFAACPNRCEVREALALAPTAQGSTPRAPLATDAAWGIRLRD